MISLLALVTVIFIGQPASSLHQTTIPVLLPSVFRPELPKIYARVQDVTKRGYTVEYDDTLDCGGDPCYVGTIEGGVVDAVSGDSSVSLANGITAKYAKFTCGPLCGPSTLMFRYRGTTYRLTMKGSSLADMRATANSLFPAQ